MKNNIIYTLLIFLFVSCQSSSQKELKPTKNSSIEPDLTSFYPYKDHYVDLNNLEVVEADGILANDFKTLSKYAYRLNTPPWFKGYPETVEFKEYYFDLDEQGNILIRNKYQELIKTIENPEKISDEDNVSESSFLLSSNHGVVHIKRMGNDQYFIIRKYNETGSLLKTLKFKHTAIEVQGNANYYKPYLNYMGCTPEQIVFSTMYNETDSTIIVNVADETLSHIQLTASGLILSEDEQFVDGFVETLEDSKVKFNFLNYDFTAEVPRFYDHAETIIIDDMIIVVYFHQIATGSALEAYNKNTGERMWKADVKQINTGHSKYYNHVYISAYKNKVIIEGIEAYGSYLQIFDIQTGKRLYAEGDFNEISE